MLLKLSVGWSSNNPSLKQRFSLKMGNKKNQSADLEFDRFHSTCDGDGSTAFNVQLRSRCKHVTGVLFNKQVPWTTCSVPVNLEKLNLIKPLNVICFTIFGLGPRAIHINFNTQLLCVQEKMPLIYFNPFTSDSAKSKIDKCSKITNCFKLKNKHHQSKPLLNSFPMNGHTLGFCL